MNPMEKTIKLTWAEVAKWLTLIVGIVSTFVVMQVKIAALEEGHDQNESRIVIMEERMRVQEAELARINQKLTNIGEDVTVIKNAILSNSFGPGR